MRVNRVGMSVGIDSWAGPKSLFLSMGYGGEGGIRTHERLAPLRAFQARLFDHSSTSPLVAGMVGFELTIP